MLKAVWRGSGEAKFWQASLRPTHALLCLAPSLHPFPPLFSEVALLPPPSRPRHVGSIFFFLFFFFNHRADRHTTWIISEVLSCMTRPRWKDWGWQRRSTSATSRHSCWETEERDHLTSSSFPTCYIFLIRGFMRCTCFPSVCHRLPLETSVRFNLSARQICHAAVPQLWASLDCLNFSLKVSLNSSRDYVRVQINDPGKCAFGVQSLIVQGTPLLFWFYLLDYLRIQRAGGSMRIECCRNESWNICAGQCQWSLMSL